MVGLRFRTSWSVTCVKTPEAGIRTDSRGMVDLLEALKTPQSLNARNLSPKGRPVARAPFREIQQVGLAA